MMNSSPSEVVELFTFVEVTRVQYATVVGHFHEVKNSRRKKRKPALLHRDPKAKDPIKAHLLPVLVRLIQNQQNQRRQAKEVEEGKKDKSEQKPEKQRQMVHPFLWRNTQEGRPVQQGASG